MRTIAFVGPSGTGKSHRASIVARQNGADGIIDDGLFISANRVIAGTSAKKAPTRLASVRQALFVNAAEAANVSRAIKQSDVKCIMILGTSDGMVQRIAEALDIPEVERIIRIEDVATHEEMETAKRIRTEEGKHVIPVPEFEIKKDFSGYFLHPLRLWQRLTSDREVADDKTIVRPTFSYLGDYTISDNVIISATRHEAMKIPSVCRVLSVNLRSGAHGVHLDVSLIMKYGAYIPSEARKIQRIVRRGVERYTSINVRRVHIYVRSLDCN